MDNIISWIKKNKVPIILTAIIIAGFLVRIITINSQDGLWCDEAYSWWVSTLSFPFGIIDELRAHDYHPPLYHFMLHFWMKLFGDSDVALRILSVIFSTASIGVSYLIGKNMKDKTCGLICAALNAFLLFNLIHAKEVRFYVPSVTFAALSLLFTIKVFDEEKITKPLIGLVISNTLLIYTLTTGAFFVAIANLVLLVFLIASKKEKFEEFLLSQFVIFLACTPQFIFMFGQYLQTRSHNPWSRMPLDPFLIFEYIKKSFMPWNGVFHQGIYTIMAVLLLIAIIVILFKIFRKHDKKFWIIFLIFCIYFLFLFLTTHFKIMPLGFNYMGIFMMMFIIIISYLITEYKQTLASILFFIVFSAQIYFGYWAHIMDDEFGNFYKPYGYKIPAIYIKEEGYGKDALIWMGWGDRLIRYIDNNAKRMLSSLDVDEVPIGGRYIIISASSLKEEGIYNETIEDERFKEIFTTEKLDKEEQDKRLGIYKLAIFERIE